MAETTPEESPTAKLIKRTGCSHIREAVSVIEQGGMRLDDLEPETMAEVKSVMASAQSVGAQAAPDES